MNKIVNSLLSSIFDQVCATITSSPCTKTFFLSPHPPPFVCSLFFLRRLILAYLTFSDLFIVSEILASRSAVQPSIRTTPRLLYHLGEMQEDSLDLLHLGFEF